MNVVFNSIYAVEPAFLFCNDAIYIRIQFLIVLSINCWVAVFCPKDYLVIYLAVAAHGMSLAAPTLLVSTGCTRGYWWLNPCGIHCKKIMPSANPEGVQLL